MAAVPLAARERAFNEGARNIIMMKEAGEWLEGSSLYGAFEKSSQRI
jgi:hypothetical protein